MSLFSLPIGSASYCDVPLAFNGRVGLRSSRRTWPPVDLLVEAMIACSGPEAACLLVCLRSFLS